MKDLIKLLKNIFSQEPFEQNIYIKFSVSLEQIIFIIFVILSLLYLIFLV
nr:MAG TPA: hypothetical protein [Caudoviricetes sp.]